MLSLISFLISLSIVLIFFSPLLHPLLDNRLNFVYGDLTSFIGNNSGFERHRTLYYIFNQRAGEVRDDEIRIGPLFGGISMLSTLIPSVTDSQIASIVVLASIIIGCYGIFKLCNLFEMKEHYRALLIPCITIFYYLNLWSVERIVHLWIWYSYAIFPLYLYCGLTYILYRKITQLIIYSLLFAIYGIIPHQFIYMFVIHVFLIIHLILLDRNIKKLLLFISIPMTIYLFSNISLLFLLFRSGLEYPIPMSIDQLSFLSRNGDLINIFTFTNNWWPQLPTTLLKNPVFLLTSLLLFMFAFLTALFIPAAEKKHRALTLFSLLFIVGIIFFMQGVNNSILLNIIHFFGRMGYIDIFAPFREWGKLAVLVPIFLVVMLLSGLTLLKDKKRFVVTSFSFIVILIINIASSPSLVYINRVYSPTYMPQEYYDLYDKIPIEHKVLWLYPISTQSILGTDRYVWNHEKATSDVIERSIGSTHNKNFEYVKMLTKEEAPQYLLNALNIKYIIKRTDILGASNFTDYQYLSCNKLDYLTICENPYNLTPFYVPRNLILSDLDGKNFYAITFLPNASHITVTSDARKYTIERAKVVLSGFESVWLYETAKEKGVLITPFNSTYFHNPAKFWSKAATADRLHAPWHYYLEQRGMNNWQSDYNKGLIFTWAINNTLEIPFTVEETNKYIFLIRLFQNQYGGAIHVQLDDKDYILNTADQLNKFIWKEIGTIDVGKGYHKITLRNLEGFNAINLFALIPKQEYEDAKIQLEQSLQDKRIIYILEAESDLYNQNSKISDKYEEASNGQMLELNETSKLSNTIEIIKTSDYIFAIRSMGHLTIKIDDREYKINSPQLNWNYIGSIGLERGKHTIELTNLAQSPANVDVIWFYNTQKENEPIENIFVDEDPAQVISYQKINPTKYVVKVNAIKPFLLSFAESYDPLWVTYVNGEKIQSIPLFGTINGFWINQQGLLEIIIEYEPQRWFYIGSIISVTTLIVCTTYLIYNWAKKNHSRT